LATADTKYGRVHSVGTIEHALSAISYFHREHGFTDPTRNPMVIGLMEGVRRDQIGRQPDVKVPMLAADLRRILKAYGRPTRPKDVRNIAGLLVHFCGGFRAQELVAITVDDVVFDGEILRVHVPTRGSAELSPVLIKPERNYSAAQALRQWLELTGIREGAIFRAVDRHANVKCGLSREAWGYIIKACCKRAGLDSRQFSAHSLRVGHIRQAQVNGVSDQAIRLQTGHASIQAIARFRDLMNADSGGSSGHLGL